MSTLKARSSLDTILFADSSKKTLGLIYPGSYHFGTDAAERMEITDGACDVQLDGTTETVKLMPLARTSMCPPSPASPSR